MARGAILRQVMSGKDNATKVDDALGTSHLVVCCDVGQLTLKLDIGLVTSGGENFVLAGLPLLNRLWSFQATITRCDLSPRFFCIDATLLCEFEIDKI